MSIAITASHRSGIADAATFIWFSKDAATDMYYGFEQNEDAATCKAASATTSTCTLSVTVDPCLVCGSADPTDQTWDQRERLYTKVKFSRRHVWG
ncbi:DUF5707 domain-containing protein [Streptomyces sp. NPDC059892]|uniref:DUF5707 domain-containing protein n=1 Tax=unclassified Streptomyces TaxID=2593676 RepID=UPI0036532EBC